MNLHEETERTENEAIVLISSLTHLVSGPDAQIGLCLLNLSFLCSLL